MSWERKSEGNETNTCTNLEFNSISIVIEIFCFADEEIPQQEIKKKEQHHLSKKPKNKELLVEGLYIIILNVM